ncbi:MAG: class I adenylate-forming enzyme family protein [Opitutaceae bacterium]
MPDTLASLWRQTVSRAPRAPALIECASGRRWTREELADSANAWRSSLPSGLDLTGRRIVLAEPNGAGWLRAFIGILLSRGIPAPIDPDEPPAAREAIARAIGASWVWDGGRLAPIRPSGRIQSGDVCLIKITSGSTGSPKAFPFTHAQMAADGRQVCATMGIRASDLNLAVIPFGHSYGLGNLVIPLLIQGTAIACGSGPFPHAIASDCRKWKPTVFPAVPVLLRALAGAEIPARSLATLRLVISAGSPLPAKDARAFGDRFGRAVHGFYGSSETGGICFDRSGAATLSGRSVGPPLDGVRIVPGRSRRFTVESAAVMGRGRHSPRDFGEMSQEGELVLLGRSDRTVKIGAKRLDPTEVEVALKSLTCVRDAVVVPNPGLGGGLAAAVLSAESPAAIRRALAGRLALWKLPDRIVRLAEFPVTARGKPDLRGIDSILRNGPAHRVFSPRGG